MRRVLFVCLYATALSAQTGLNAVTLSATAYINGSGNNGIANAAAACAALPKVTCIVQIPFNYPGTDQVAGFAKDFTAAGTSTYAPNTIIQDERNGIARYVTNSAPYSYSNQKSFYVDQSIYYSPNRVNVLVHQYKDSVLAGGCEWYFTSSSYCISNYQPSDYFGYNNTYGQEILRGADVEHNGPGDTLGESEIETSVGGLSSASTDEGLEWKDILVQQGNGTHGTAEFQAPVRVGGDKVKTITIGDPTQAAGTLGEGRWLYDARSAPLTNSATKVAACDDFSRSPCLLTLGAAVSASTAIGTVSTAITAFGPQPVTPSLNTGEMSSFSPASLVCVADAANDPEMIFPSAVTGTTLTLNFRRPHAAGFIISTGGLCGYVLEFNADRVTNATHPEINIAGVYVTGTLRRFWMVIATPSATTLQLAVNGKGAWRSVLRNSSWNATKNNAITLWRAARVAAISTTPGLNSGAGGGPISLADNIVPWTAGSLASEALGAGVGIGYGNHNIVNYFGNFYTNSGGFGLGYNGILNSGSMLGLANNTPVSYYHINGGGYDEPDGITMTGQTLYTFFAQYGGRYADIAIGCPSNGCVNQFHKVLQMSDRASGDSDSLYMNEATGEPSITANNGAFTFGFRKDGFEMAKEASASAASAPAVGKLYLNTGNQVCVNNSSGVTFCASPGFTATAITLTPGKGVTSATCTSARCDLNGGSVRVVGGSFTTGVFVTVGYALAAAPRTCSVAMNGGSKFVGLGHGTPTAASFTITSAVSIAELTVDLDYSCRP